MRNKPQKVPTVRLRNSYVTTIVSISLVLFLLGMLGLLLLNAKMIGDYVRENIGFTVILKRDVKEADLPAIEKLLRDHPAIKEFSFVPAEQAAEELQRELGENFLEFLGENPLHPSYNLRLNAAYANPDSLTLIETDLMKQAAVHEVFYQESMVHLVNDNLKKISVVILVFSILLFLVSVALFNNTIRLLVYSKRFIIKTMQMVGANRSFIRRPFLIRGLLHGVIGSAVATLLLLGLLQVARKRMPEVLVFTDMQTVGVLVLFMFLIGILLTWLTTVMAVNKYLTLDRDSLYY
ncbi:MAG: permease-like cell division protein FtsX [Bacteroidales bacterium]